MQKKKRYSREKVEHIQAHNEKLIRAMNRSLDKMRSLPGHLITEGVMKHCVYLRNAISALTWSNAVAEQSMDPAENVNDKSV